MYVKYILVRDAWYPPGDELNASTVMSYMKNNVSTMILTHLPLNKMAAILADDTFKCIFLNENDRIRIQISLKFVLRGAIDSEPALIQVMAWRRTGDKPFPEPMMTLFTDAYIRHQGGDELTHDSL